MSCPTLFDTDKALEIDLARKLDVEARHKKVRIALKKWCCENGRASAANEFEAYAAPDAHTVLDHCKAAAIPTCVVAQAIADAGDWTTADEVREALRVGLIPTVNSMLVMGIVSLPGMMTGQILAGAAPGDAVRYQIMIVFMIAATVSTATFGVTMLAYGRIFTSDHRLRSAGALGIQLD